MVNIIRDSNSTTEVSFKDFPIGYLGGLKKKSLLCGDFRYKITTDIPPRVFRILYFPYNLQTLFSRPPQQISVRPVDSPSLFISRLSPTFVPVNKYFSIVKPYRKRIVSIDFEKKDSV